MLPRFVGGMRSCNIWSNTAPTSTRATTAVVLRSELPKAASNRSSSKAGPRPRNFFANSAPTRGSAFQVRFKSGQTASWRAISSRGRHGSTGIRPRFGTVRLWRCSIGLSCTSRCIASSHRATRTGQPIFAPVKGSVAQQGARTGHAQSNADGPLSRALLDEYCVGCHNQRTVAQGRPAFDQLNLDDISTEAPVLEKIVKKLRTRQMPPEGARRPDQETIEGFVAALETALDKQSARAPHPGQIVTHRLNRFEYANVIADLMALAVRGGH